MSDIASRYPHFAVVPGLLDDEAAQATEDVLTYQRSRGLTADIMEIGVGRGKYFILLAKGLADEEIIVGIDVFESLPPDQDVTPSSRDDCILALKRWLPELWGTDRLIILEDDSRNVAKSDYATTIHGTFRFISVDGGHDEVTVYSDLQLAHHLLIKGGLVALDDGHDEVPSQDGELKLGWRMYAHWAEVHQREPRLRVVAKVANKLLLCNDGVWAGDYRRLIADRAHKDDPP